ncbi:DUF4349 domain-containing protein [Mucilaginibacter lappiensis]|uniref:DUF4349 domain-containing protein n=1 Tax=Mucilaginibacter lappiensis TaxID=354630 RepID=A0A1N6S8M8_9SPHI|nr:DUF4349 domain-containing protein [Mucilaginibacter lappiensis]MBB6108453.1 hypothetical protein [Mucilaginibacter lappiensis]MBB6131554.1 hypothetical protein [Mucilaginibacter lappiensis]SIQ37409.1 protein of unknown function [Mucilaginibacter lappiensis]
MKAYLISITLLLSLSACGHKAEEQKEKAQAVSFAPPAVKPDDEALEKTPVMQDIAIAEPSGNSTSPSQVRDTTKKIIKSGTIQFEVSNINAARKKILQSLKKYGGYVDEDNQTTNSDINRKEYNLKVSIPAKYFDSLLDSVSASADKIDTKNITVSDVTTRYIDMKTRLDNKKILENRYLELLKKGTKISDLMEIENKLTEIRSDIESAQGQLNYLNKQIAYSSLDITFYTKATTQNIDDQFTNKFKTSISTGWTFSKNLFFGIISIWPILLIAGIVYFMLKSWRKRVKKTE